jgi:aromatic-L-amino-acid decarboxylase
MKPELLPRLDDRTVVCIQAGNVNTGAFDPAKEICSRAQEAKQRSQAQDSESKHGQEL